MTTIKAQVRTIPGTQAAEGRTGEHAVVVDRPAGAAGGAGTGMNGGELLALAIGGCLANDVRYVADGLGVQIDDVTVDVDIELIDGRVTGAAVRLDVTAPDDTDTTDVVPGAE